MRILKTTLAHIGLLCTNLFFAINLSAVKYFTTPQMAGPYGINLVRLGVCVILFWLFFIFQKTRERLQKGDIFKMILCAMMAISINQMMFMKGLSLTYSIHASLLLLITPILITFIAAWMLREKITRQKLLGLMLGVAGAIVLVTSRGNSGSGNDIILGDLLVVASTIAYTFYFIIVKPLMQKYPYMDVMRWVFTLGFFMILPFCWREFVAIPWHTFGLKQYFIMFIIVVPGTFLAYIFNVYGIKVLSASTAGAYIYSQPVFAVLIAMFYLGEPLEFYKVVAAVLIFTGVYLTRSQVTRKDQKLTK